MIVCILQFHTVRICKSYNCRSRFSNKFKKQYIILLHFERTLNSYQEQLGSIITVILIMEKQCLTYVEEITHSILLRVSKHVNLRF